MIRLIWLTTAFLAVIATYILRPVSTISAQVSDKIIVPPIDLLPTEPKKIAIVPGKSNYQIEEEKKPKKVAKTVRKGVYKSYTSTKVKMVQSQPSSFCSCVTYARYKSGINTGSVGYARNWPINSVTPRPGGVVVTREGRVGHVGVVTSVNDNSINIIEANYVRCRLTERTLPLNSSVIRGYYN